MLSSHLGFGTQNATASSNENFKLHVLKEPQSLDPQSHSASVNSYVMQNIHRGLLKYDNTKGLVSDLAEKCSLSSKKLLLTCNLKKNLKWNDNSPIVAKDFIKGIEYLLKNQSKSSFSLGLLNLKNASQYIEAKLSFDEVGAAALNDHTLQFEFSEPQNEFEYNLIQTALSPRPNNEQQYSGPYQLKEWKKGERIILTKNMNYPGGNPNRPDVEFLFINEDSTALKLYEKNQLDFLRRLPTAHYNEWKNKDDFQSFEVLRFDYYGLNNSTLNIEQRKLLAESLDYSDLQKIYNSIGRPGCASLPSTFFKKNKIPCLKYSIKDPKKNKLSHHQTWKTEDLVISYSTQGGDDHRRLAEWLQSQWKNHLGLDFRIQSMENKVFISQLNNNPTAVFRKGATLDRPTCLSAIEIFSKKHPENFLKIDSTEFENLLNKLRLETKESKQKSLCSKAVEYLLEQYYFIPAGRYDFFTLLKPQFRNISINYMNQLFLENLSFLSK